MMAVLFILIVAFFLLKQRKDLYVEPNKYDEYTLEEKLKMPGFKLRSLWQGLNVSVKHAHLFHLFVMLRKLFLAVVIVYAYGYN